MATETYRLPRSTPSGKRRRSGAGAEGITEKPAGENITALRRLTLIGVLTGLAAVIPYAESIPWLELQSLIVFAAGYLLGARAGAMIGAVAMGFYSLANPQGMAHPVVFTSQVLGRALVGAMGGWSASIGLPRSIPLRSGALAVWAIGCSISYDLFTNVASGIVYGQMIPSLVLGIPWALAHLASNAVFFVVVGLPLIRLLEPRRAQLMGVIFAIVALSGAVPARAQTPADTVQVEAAERPTIPAAIDTVSRSTPDSISTAVTDSLPAAPPGADSLRAGDSLVVRVRPLPPATPPTARWELTLDPGATWRRGSTDSDDALTLLANAPRFYGDAGSVEPLRFSALPGGWEIGIRDGIPQWARSTPWQDPTRIEEGARAGWSWAPLGRPSAPYVPQPRSPIGRDQRDADDGTDIEPGWANRSVEPRQGRPLTSVWVGSGSFTRRVQGFNLQLFEGVAGIPWRIGWSAWSRGVGPLGELGRTGAHGTEITLGGQGRTWKWEAAYQSDRTSISSSDGSVQERRPLEAGWSRFDWWERPQGGRYLGAAVLALGEQTTGDRSFDSELKRYADQYSASAWGGRRLANWEYGATVSWTRQVVRHYLDAKMAYDPRDLDVWAVLLESRARHRLGHWHAAVTIENAASVTSVMPQLEWRSAGGPGSGLYLSAGGVRATALAEAGKLGNPTEGPEIERPNGWVATAGLRHHLGGPDQEPISEPALMQAALAGGEFRLQVSATGWSLKEVLYPAFGLFGRTVLEKPAIRADVDGAAVTARLEWAPILGLEVGFSGYAAGREIPAGAASAAPDYRALVVIGPRFRLFSSSVELAIQAEIDHMGERVSAEGVLSPITRLGGRLIVNFGDAWLVIRGVDLDDKLYDLPGSVLGTPLRSAGRQIRLYGEWRLLD